MPRLIFDIETIGEDFDALDATTQESLTSWIKQSSKSDTEYELALKNLKEGMGFSPLTGQIVAIGVLDADKDKGTVYFQAPNKPITEEEIDGVKYKPASEAAMLEKFWQGAAHYQEFITYNGRSFDVLFMMVRSAIQNIRPSKNLMSNRYLNSQKFDALHIDLKDQLSFYGAVPRPGSLHMWCHAFGIASPKAEGISGDDVGQLFKEGQYQNIARYNARDLVATKQLFTYWQKYLR